MSLHQSKTQGSPNSEHELSASSAIQLSLHTPGQVPSYGTSAGHRWREQGTRFFLRFLGQNRHLKITNGYENGRDPPVISGNQVLLARRVTQNGHWIIGSMMMTHICGVPHSQTNLSISQNRSLNRRSVVSAFLIWIARLWPWLGYIRPVKEYYAKWVPLSLLPTLSRKTLRKDY